ncbi:MAG: carbon-nitrogen hydrolase [Bacteroidetes bacterium]|nr:carbon-nitrogen hydrolase [Bacteroidota bacterium]
MSDTVHISAIQFSCSTDPAVNLARAIELTRSAAKEGAKIVCLPELFLTRYFCQTEDPGNYALAEAVPGPTSKIFEALSAELGVSIVLSLFEKRTEGLYHNTACVVDPIKGYMGKYRKMHIPDDPLFMEKYYFAPGDLGVQIFETQGVKLAVLICWDQWFPEAARIAALKGAQVICYPTAIGWQLYEKESHGAAQYGAWETIQRSHAVANNCFVVAVNRTGFEPTSEAHSHPNGIQFWGQTFIAGPDGAIIKQASETEEGVVSAHIRLKAIPEQRHGWPFLRDRRTDVYGDLTKTYLDD